MGSTQITLFLGDSLEQARHGVYSTEFYIKWIVYLNQSQQWWWIIALFRLEGAIRINYFVSLLRNMNTYIKPELSILKLLRDPKRMDIVLTIDIFFCGEFEKLGSDLLSTIDIILRKLINCNIYLGAEFFICTINHKKIQPIKYMPLLTPPHIISCF